MSDEDDHDLSGAIERAKHDIREQHAIIAKQRVERDKLKLTFDTLEQTIGLYRASTRSATFELETKRLKRKSWHWYMIMAIAFFSLRLAMSRGAVVLEFINWFAFLCAARTIYVESNVGPMTFALCVFFATIWWS